VARLSEARAECINAGTTAALAIAETSLARAYVAMKRFDDARAVTASALATSREHNQLDFEAISLAIEGEIHGHEGKLQQALNCFDAALAKFDERKSRVVELRFFGGLSVAETASILNVSPDTVMRDWRLAKAWLQEEMRGDHPDDDA
jgi:DNA-directed RNA polymerase specialized sigma24 family protein